MKPGIIDPARRTVRLLAVCLITLGAAALPLLPSSAHAQVPARQPTPPVARTVVSFTWGGGFRNQVGALPVFRRYGMHATFYVPSGLVCQLAVKPGCDHNPYLTLSDVHQIAAAGNEIGGLSVEHVPLSGMPAAEAQREICDDRVNLTRWGYRVTDFAYPFALVTGPLEALARRCGYNSALGTGQLRGAGLCPGCAWAETIPPRNPYLLRAPIEVSSVGTLWTAATFEDTVTDAQEHGGGWIIFTVHDVCAKSCPLGVTVPELSAVLAWLSRRAGDGLSVRTVRQVMGGPVRPVVAGPAPPPIKPPGVANSRLADVAADGIPVCFQASRFGANHATFAYLPRGGPARSGAEEISMTQRSSGTAQLLPTLDLGTCAPSVSAGRTYTLGAWYKSTQPVVFDAYYRTQVGTWAFWTTSPPMPASRSWTQAHWNPPSVPGGASAVSFGLAMNSDGTLATSRYSLLPAQYSYTTLIVVGSLVAAIVVTAIAAGAARRRRGASGTPVPSDHGNGGSGGIPPHDDHARAGRH